MNKRTLRILLAGDSISFGYGPIVRELLSGRLDVQNLPENGRTSANLLAHIEEWMIKPAFEIIHLNCGLHDVLIDPGSSSHRVPVEQYEKNLEEIIRRLKEETSAKLVWATTTPVIDELREAKGGTMRWDKDVKAYNEVACRVMAGFGIPVNNLYKVIEDAGKEECISADGTHMNAKGYRLLAKTVADFLCSL